MLSRLVRPMYSFGTFGQLSPFQSSQGVMVRFAATAVTATPGSEVEEVERKKRQHPSIPDVIRANLAANYKEGPERDLVNFPRDRPRTDPPACTWGFIPESYFQFFYPKLGVTGGWTFGLGFATYMLSKEHYVLEHEFWNGVGLLIIVVYATKVYGPMINKYLQGEIQKDVDEMNDAKYEEIDGATESIENEKKAQWQAEGYKMLFDAKRENVAFQQEAVYRERVMNVYNEVKKRLDYQVEKLNVEKNVEQRHMANWIINKVTKSITAESEQENIKKCIADLKLLATKA